MDATGARHPSLAPDATIAGRYRVQARLGRGGMGSIYRVRDERTGRVLALKRMREDRRTDPVNAALLRAHFEREYHTLCQLAHPRIIEVYDYGFIGDEPYYMMELLDGEDLSERGQMAWKEACAALRDVASSLAMLHSRRLLHRDISPRNVRLTADGRAKLIDFGAMSPMGPAKHVVGTAPFVPPEVLQGEALDGRSDLYALGVLAYWVLTGHYPFPARALTDLRTLWQRPPPSPSQRGLELPRPLDELIMQLLQLDRAARPGSAAEVMERLSGIAGLPLSELPQVTKAYLSMPTLVGRRAALDQVRDRLRAALAGNGTSVLIEGDDGTGRTRFLEACVLEAKLLGATTLHAAAADGAGVELGVARELAEQALEALPELAQQSARSWRAQLVTLLPDLMAPTSMAPAPQSLNPMRMQTALRDWILAIACTQPLVIAVDDVESIDEASMNWLSALSLAGELRHLTVLMARRSSAPADARLEMLREHASSIRLDELDGAQTQALLQSVFGDVDHVAGIAKRIHDIAHGNPRWTMLLTETLVERGLARYEAGSWALPAQLASSDLPESLTAALASTLAALPGEAHALAEALSLTEPALLPSESYAELLPGADKPQALKALHSLLDRGVLAPEGAGYRFAQREFAQLLRASLSPERATELHGRLARAALVTGDPVLIARHELRSGDGRRAIERLLPLARDAEPSFSERMLEVLQLATEAARGLSLKATADVVLEPWLLAQAAVLGQLELFKRHVGPVLERLERDSGLRDYHELSPALPEPERLRLALAAAQARHDALPEPERGLAPKDAAWQLGRVCFVVVCMAAVANELEIVERLPVLTPLAPICPALVVTQKHIETQLHMQRGRFDMAIKATFELLGLLDLPEYALDALSATELRNATLYVLGLMGAVYGLPQVEQYMAQLEAVPGLRVLAWRVRMITRIALGDPEGAARCRKRAEVLLQEDAGRLPFPGSTAATELIIYSTIDDLVGTKRAMERIIPMAQLFPSWIPQRELALAEYQRIQGDARAALATVEAVIESAPPARHSAWGRLAELHVRALSMVDRHAEALSRGFGYLEIATRENLGSAAVGILRCVAEALTVAGRPADALPLIDQNLHFLQQAGARGAMLGRSLEIRARVAIALRDEAGFRIYAERCAREYKGAYRHGLSGKYERLLREAKDAGLEVNTSLLQATDTSVASGDLSGSRQLLSSIDGPSRVPEGLRVLVEQSGAEGGLVFALNDDRLELRANVDEFEPDASLVQALRAFVRRQLATEEGKTTYGETTPDDQEPGALTDAAGHTFVATPLYARQDNESVLSGVAMLRYGHTRRGVVRRDLLDAIGEALLAPAVAAV